jgi:hypothetical protein
MPKPWPRTETRGRTSRHTAWFAAAALPMLFTIPLAAFSIAESHDWKTVTAIIAWPYTGQRPAVSRLLEAHCLAGSPIGSSVALCLIGRALSGPPSRIYTHTAMTLVLASEQSSGLAASNVKETGVGTSRGGLKMVRQCSPGLYAFNSLAPDTQ